MPAHEREPDSLEGAARRWAAAAAPQRKRPTASGPWPWPTGTRSTTRAVCCCSGGARWVVPRRPWRSTWQTWSSASRTGRARRGSGARRGGGPRAPAQCVEPTGGHAGAAARTGRSRAHAGGCRARTQRLAAELLLGWGQPADGWRLFEQSLVNSSPSTENGNGLAPLRRLAGAVATPAGHRVRGLALARWAEPRAVTAGGASTCGSGARAARRRRPCGRTRSLGAPCR